MIVLVRKWGLTYSGFKWQERALKNSELEASTKKQRIDPRLQASGWHVSPYEEGQSLPYIRSSAFEESRPGLSSHPPSRHGHEVSAVCVTSNSDQLSDHDWPLNWAVSMPLMTHPPRAP